MKSKRTVALQESDAPESSAPTIDFSKGGTSNAMRQELLRQSQVGNPTEREPWQYSEQATVSYFHEDIGIEDAHNTPTDSRGEKRIKDRNLVRLKRTEDNPIQRVDAPARDRKLFETPRRKTDTSSDEWQPIKSRKGTLDNPIEKSHILTEQLYIEQRPQNNDIIQGGISDCYFLAALNTIVNQDPGRIQSMMQMNGDTVTVTFFRQDPAAPNGQQWIPTPIHVDKRLLTAEFRSTLQSGDLGLQGSKFLIGDSPIEAEWYVDITNRSLNTRRDTYYQTAIWAPLMEKAWAKFAEQYGKYGTGLSETDSGKSGYDLIEWGHPQMCYNLFYGDEVTEMGVSEVHSLPQNISYFGPEVVQLLLQQKGVGTAEGESYFLTASNNDSASIPRLRYYATFLLNRPYIDAYGAELKSILEQIVAADDTTTIELARSLTSDQNKWAVLYSDAENGDFKRFLDVVLIVKNSGTDSNKDSRFIYGQHSYSVLDSAFIDSKGQPMNIQPSDLDNEPLPDISPQFSTVTIRNPHSTNTVNRTGTEEESTTGIMTLTLEEFHRAFHVVKYGKRENSTSMAPV